MTTKQLIERKFSYAALHSKPQIDGSTDVILTTGVVTAFSEDEAKGIAVSLFDGNETLKGSGIRAIKVWAH